MPYSHGRAINGDYNLPEPPPLTHDQIIARVQKFHDELGNRKFDVEECGRKFDETEEDKEFTKRLLNVLDELIGDHYELFESFIR